MEANKKNRREAVVPLLADPDLLKASSFYIIGERGESFLWKEFFSFLYYMSGFYKYSLDK